MMKIVILKIDNKWKIVLINIIIFLVYFIKDNILEDGS